MRISSQGRVGQTAKGLIIEVLIDPSDLTAGRLLDNAVGAVGMVVGGLGKLRGKSSSCCLQQQLKLAGIAVLDEEAVRIMAIG